MPDHPLVKSRKSLRMAMKELAITARKSDRAYVERDLAIRYIDFAGNRQAYTGPAATFDWSKVKHVWRVAWRNVGTGLMMKEKTPPNANRVMVR